MRSVIASISHRYRFIIAHTPQPFAIGPISFPSLLYKKLYKIAHTHPNPIKKPPMESCTNCNVLYTLVYDWHAGDVVCTRCGLVQYEPLIDDRVPPSYEDDSQQPLLISMAFHNTSQGNSNKQVTEEINFKTTIYENCNEDEALATLAYENFSKIPPKTIQAYRGRKRSSYRSHAFYQASMTLNRGYTPTFSIRLFSADPKHFWSLFSEYKPLSIPSQHLKIQRLIHSLHFLENKEAHLIIKKAKTIYDRLQTQKQISLKFQESKLLSSICIYALIQSQSPQISITPSLLKSLGVSKVTYRKVEAVLESIFCVT